MCGCKQWSTDINESNYNMQPFTIEFAVRVRKDYTHAPCMFIWAKFGYCPGRVRIHFTPLCQCISEETLKAIGPFYLVSMARGSKISHQSSLERVTITHSKLCPPEVRLCSRKRCFALVSEEDRITCPCGT